MEEGNYSKIKGFIISLQYALKHNKERQIYKTFKVSKCLQILGGKKCPEFKVPKLSIFVNFEDKIGPWKSATSPYLL